MGDELEGVRFSRNSSLRLISCPLLGESCSLNLMDRVLGRRCLFPLACALCLIVYYRWDCTTMLK